MCSSQSHALSGYQSVEVGESVSSDSGGPRRTKAMWLLCALLMVTGNAQCYSFISGQVQRGQSGLAVDSVVGFCYVVSSALGLPPACAPTTLGAASCHLKSRSGTSCSRAVVVEDNAAIQCTWDWWWWWWMWICKRDTVSRECRVEGMLEAESDVRQDGPVPRPQQLPQGQRTVWIGWRRLPQPLWQSMRLLWPGTSQSMDTAPVSQQVQTGSPQMGCTS